MSSITIAIICVIAFIGGIVVGYFGHSFFTSSDEEKTNTIKKVLLYLVAMAEKELGGGTGDLKLAKVYEEFTTQYPDLAKAITYEQFKTLVNEVLKEFEDMLKDNKKIEEYIKGSEA